MSVYAKKNSKGQPTGQWVVEVTREGRRLRESFRDLAEARAAEVALLAGVPSTYTPRAVPEAPKGYKAGTAAPYTVGDLLRDGAHLWHGDKNETKSVRRFEVAMGLLGVDKPLTSIKMKELNELIDALRASRDPALKDSTVHRHLCCVSKAFAWAAHEDQGFLMRRPSFPWKSLEKSEPRKDIVSPEDDARLMAHFQALGDPRWLTIIDLMLSTGVRAGELTRLAPEDFDLTTNLLTVGNWFKRTKNGQSRELHVETALMIECRALAAKGWPKYDTLHRHLSNAKKALGIETRIGAHAMRHTYATRLNKAGVPTATIQKIMGHKSEVTTKGYIHPDNEDLVAAAQTQVRSRGNVEAIGGGNRGVIAPSEA